MLQPKMRQIKVWKSKVIDGDMYDIPDNQTEKKEKDKEKDEEDKEEFKDFLDKYVQTGNSLFDSLELKI